MTPRILVLDDDPAVLSLLRTYFGGLGWYVEVCGEPARREILRPLRPAAGGLVSGKPTTVDPSKPDWANASGGYTPGGGRTSSADNSVYWIMADFVKRRQRQ